MSHCIVLNNFIIRYNELSLRNLKILSEHFSIVVYRWLAEPDDGAGDNYWIVNQLLQRYPDKTETGEELEGPHYDDQWWIGAKSHVSFFLVKLHNHDNINKMY